MVFNLNCASTSRSYDTREEDGPPPTGSISIEDEERETASIALHAISELGRSRNPQGSTYKTIVGYMNKNYVIPIDQLRKYLPMAMQNGLKFGVFRKVHDKYKINRDFLNPQVPLRRRSGQICKRCLKLKRPNHIKIALQNYAEVPSTSDVKPPSKYRKPIAKRCRKKRPVQRRQRKTSPATPYRRKRRY